MKPMSHVFIALLLLLTAAPAQAQLEGGFLAFDEEEMTFQRGDGNLTAHIAYVLHCSNVASFTLDDGWVLRVDHAILHDGEPIEAAWAPETVEQLIEHRFCATSTTARAAVDLVVQAPKGLVPGEYRVVASATASAGDFTTEAIHASYTVVEVAEPAQAPTPRAAGEPTAAAPGPALPLLALAALALAARRRA